jgi:hypothetical protein
MSNPIRRNIRKLARAIKRRQERGYCTGMTRDQIDALIRAIRCHQEHVNTLAAFLELKQSELRPGDDISFLGLNAAKQELMVEQSILSGHAFMVEQDIRAKHIKLDEYGWRVLRLAQEQVRP